MLGWANVYILEPCSGGRFIYEIVSLSPATIDVQRWQQKLVGSYISTLCAWTFIDES